MTRRVIGVEKTVLRWARETAGPTAEAVAATLKRDVGEVRAWEAGEAAPTYSQLEKLAYVVYKRPLAIFFLPSPPVGKRRPRSGTATKGHVTGRAMKAVVGGPSKPRFAYRPDSVSAPGESLRDLLGERLISPSRLAERMGCSVREINEILRGTRAIDGNIARALEAALGTPAQFWLNRERRYRAFLAEQAAPSGRRA